MSSTDRPYSRVRTRDYQVEIHPCVLQPGTCSNAWLRRVYSGSPDLVRHIMSLTFAPRFRVAAQSRQVARSFPNTLSLQGDFCPFSLLLCGQGTKNVI